EAAKKGSLVEKTLPSRTQSDFVSAGITRQKKSTGKENVTWSKPQAGIGSRNAKRIADASKIATKEAIAPRDSQNSWKLFSIGLEDTYLTWSLRSRLCLADLPI